MVKTYNKLIFRQLKKNPSRFLAVLAIAILGIAFITGLLASAPNMFATLDAYFDKNNIQDITIKSAVGFTMDDIKTIADNEHIEQITPIITFDVSIESQATRVYQLPFAADDIMQLNVVTGVLPKESNEIAVEQSGTFLKSKDIGSTINIMNKEYVVTAIVNNPWYFGNEKETTNIGMGSIDIIIYMPLGDTAIYTDILVTIRNAKNKLSFSADYEKLIKNAKDELMSIDTNDNWYFLDRSTSQGYIKYDENVTTIQSIADVFPFYFILIATLVVLTTMTRMVDAERNQIGILKALGYSNAQIRFKYIFFAILPTLLGAIIGLLAGFQIFPRIIYSIFAKTIFAPPLTMGFYLETSLLTSLGMILAIVLATILAINSKLKETAAELLIPKAPRGGKKVFLEHISFIWRRLKFKYKSTVRNVFRYKKHLFMALIGIGGCTALIFTGLGLKGAVSGISTTQYQEILQYQLNIGVDGTINEDLNNFLLKTDRHLAIKQQTDYFEYGDESIVVTLMIVSDDKISQFSNFINLRERNNHRPINLEDGLVVTEGLAKHLKLGMGDNIDVFGYSYKIKSIAENYVGNYFYLSESKYQDEYYDTNILVADNDLTNIAETMQMLLRLSTVTSVSTIQDAKEMYERINEQLDLVIVVIILAAGSLAIIVTYNLTNVNIEERIREMATLKVLGYYDSEVGGYVYREVSILTLLGTAVGLLVGFFLERFIIGLIDSTSMMLSRALPWYTFVIAISVTIISSVIVCLILYPKLKKIDMYSSLKVMT